MEIKVIRIEDIRESEFNPRVRLEKGSPEYEQIEASLREFGFIEPLVVNEHNMRLVGGHQRLQVLRDTGVAEVECVMINEPDEDREKVLCLALNKIKGDWDMEKLTALLGDEDVSVFPTGFLDGEIDLDKYLEDTPEDPMGGDDETDAEAELEEDLRNVSTVIKIGSYSFTVKAPEYYALLEDIRDKGIFEPAAIKEELQRRILSD
ncbi:MAG: ParB N-terminal domain-containing protein [Lachnospiraceae bacterium]|nr:ParB N-terminal domain-containing protein [Lachnospiraceae bacterium]